VGQGSGEVAIGRHRRRHPDRRAVGGSRFRCR